MSKYNVVKETRSGNTYFSIMDAGCDRTVFSGTAKRSNTAERMEDAIQSRATRLLLNRLIGKTTRDEMMTEAKDVFGCFRSVAESMAAEILPHNGDMNVRNHAQRLQQIANKITLMEGPHGLYHLADDGVSSLSTRRRQIGDNVDDVSVEIRIVRNHEVILEGNINAYHDLTVEDGRTLNTRASTEDKPVYMDTMRVHAGIRGRFDDESLFPLLQARLALMKGEPLKSLAKKSLTIAARAAVAEL